MQTTGKTEVLKGQSSHFCVDLDICFASLSCWKFQWRLSFSCRFYFRCPGISLESMMPCGLTRFSEPLEEKLPCNTIEPSPYFTVHLKIMYTYHSFHYIHPFLFFYFLFFTFWQIIASKLSFCFIRTRFQSALVVFCKHFYIYMKVYSNVFG